MNTCTRRVISWIAAVALLITCGISGLVLPAAATTGGNLIPNGDFEQGATATWTGTNDIITVEDGVGYGGTKGLQFAAGAAKDIYFKNFAPALEANSVYELRFLAKGPKIRATINSVTDITMSTVYTEKLGDEWVVVRALVKTKDAPKFDKNWGLYLRRDDTTTEPTYVDNVELVKADTPESLIGGDFTTIGINHWKNHIKAPVNATVVTEGDNKALKIPGSTTAFGDKYIMAPYFEIGETYTLTLKVKGAPLNIYLYGNSGNYASGDDVSVWHVTEQSDTYKTYSYTFKAGSGLAETSSYFLNITRKDAATLTGGDSYIDDVSIVKQVKLTGITLNKTAETLTVGDAVKLTATAVPAGAVLADLTWESADSTIATVDGGVVKAVAAGTTTITAKVGDITAACTVTVEPVSENIVYQEKFENGAAGMFTAATTQKFYIAEGQGFGGEGNALGLSADTGDRWLRWSNVTFEPNTRYLITFLAKGPQVRFGLYQYAGSATWKGAPALTGLAYTNPYQNDWTSYRVEFITGNEPLAAKSGQANYGFFFNRQTAATEATLIDNFKIEKIDEYSERVTGGDFEQPGMQQWNSKHLKETDKFEVVVDPDDASNKVLKIAAASAKLGDHFLQGLYVEAGLEYEITFRAKGAPMSLFVPGKNSSGGDLADTWGETEVSSEWKTYTFTFKATENAAAAAEASWILNITRNMAATEPSYIDDFSIKAKKATAVESITLDKTAETLLVGATATLTATVSPAGASYDSLTWESSNTAVATVVDGVVTAVAAGTATITVKVGEITATCTVTVEEPAPVDENLIYEDKFENGADGMFAGATGTSFYIAEGQGLGGGNALGLSAATGDRWLKWNGITFEPNTRYSITFVAKGPQVRLGLYKYTGTAVWKSGSAVVWTNPYKDDWTSYRAEFTTGSTPLAMDPNSAGYGFYFNRSSAATEATLIDNFKIEKTDENTERVIGGDFEQPGMQQWNSKHLKETDKFEVVVDPDNANNKVLKIAAASAKLGDHYLQGLYLEAGRLYEITFRAKGAPMSLYMAGKNSTGVLADTWAHTETSTEWKTYSYTFVTKDRAAADDEAPWILNITRNMAADTATYVDDFSIKTKEVPNAESISLDKTSDKVGIGATTTLTATIAPTGAKYDSLTWESSNTAVATVVDGVVTGVAAGEAIITAKAMVGTTALTATCTVKVVVKATRFEIAQSEIHLAPANSRDTRWVYDEIKLITEPADADIGALTWTSSDATVVSVENGLIKSHKAGTATITVTDGTLTDSVTVKVSDEGERISGGDFDGNDWNNVYWTNHIIKNGAGSLVADPTNPDNTVLSIPASITSAKWLWPAHVNPGRTYKLTFKAMNAEGQAVVYFSSPSATISGWIYKTIAAEGWTEVTYIFTTNSLDDGTSAALNRNYLFGFGNQKKNSPLYIDDVSLVELPLASAITIEDIDVPVKGTATLNVTTTPAQASAGALTWTSSDPSIISVDANGKLTAVAGKGSVTITVTNGTLTDTATATITGEAATGIALSKNTVYLTKLGTEKLAVNTVPAVALYDAFVWTSSDPTVATIAADGTVTATDKAGTTTITVTSGELTATCVVTVMDNATSFELADESIKLAPGIGSTLRVTKTLQIVTTPLNTYPGELTWSSGNTAVATVDENGKVTAVAEGTAVITVSKDGAPVDTCEVVVAWDGERITGGDFEGDDWNVKQWQSIIKTGRGTVVSDPANADNMVVAFPRNDEKLDALWINNLHVNAGKTYKLSFKVKGDGTDGQQLAIYFHGTSVSLNGWKYVSDLKANEWKEVSYVFTTNALDDGSSAALNRNYCCGIDTAKPGMIYLDDFSLVELPEATAIILPDEEVKLWPTGSTSLAVRTEPAEASAGKLTWVSSDPSVIAVDQNGKVTAVADNGSVTITVTTEKGLTDTVTVSIDEYANLLENGDFEQGDLNWPSHAIIKPGVGKDGSAGLVLDYTKKTDVFFKGKLPVDPGTTYIVEWDYLPTTDAEMRIWAGQMGLSLNSSSGNGTEWKHGSKVFTTPNSMPDVNSAALKGWILSIVCDAPGTSPAIVDNFSLKLYNSGVKVESIKLNYDSITMMPGRTQNLGIMATPADGDVNKAIWTSSNEDVATVEYGIVTAVGKGEAVITATLRDGSHSASCKVTVSGNPAFIINGTFEQTNNTWGVAGGTKIESGIGVQSSNAAAIPVGGELTYEVKDLQPETTYQFFVRYRSAKDSKLKINLLNGSTDLLANPETGAEKVASVTGSWTKATYEFTTGATVEDITTLKLTVAGGEGPIYVDHVLLTQKATLIDFVVNGLVWTDGEQVKPGTELMFAVTITNQGEDPVKAGSKLDIDICMDSKPIQTITHIFETEFASGATEMIIGSETWAAVEGDHVISARVNSSLSILESNTDNNNMVQTDLRVNEEFLKVPELAEQAGFTTLGFSDDFDSLATVDTGATGADGYKWYVHRPYGATTLTTADYSVENGILTMKNVIPTYNMGFSSADVKTGVGYTWNKGYLEYKVRIPRPRQNTKEEDGVPAVWSLPLDKLMSVKGSDWVEMDWLEYWGTTTARPGGYYTITMHDQGTDENDKQIYYNKNTNHSKEGLGDGEWHVMAFLWVENQIIGFVDDVEVFRIAYDEETFSNPMQSVIMPDERGGVGAFSYMNVQELVLHLGGSKDNPMEIDYVHIWTGVDNGEFTPEVDEDGVIGGGSTDDEGGEDIAIDFPADEFWYNYGTDIYGDLIMEINEDTYATVLEGAEYWPLLSEERRAEINALFVANGQPTFDELIAELEAFLESSPEAQAALFIATYLLDEYGDPIMEVTEDNFMQILLSAVDFNEMDDDLKILVLLAMEELGMPTYDSLLMDAMAIAEELGLLEDLEIPEIEIPDIGTSDEDDTTDEESPETGARTSLWLVALVVMLASAAVLWFSRKRQAA